MITKTNPKGSGTYLNALGIVSALGSGKREVLTELLLGSTKGVVQEEFGITEHTGTPVGRVSTLAFNDMKMKAKSRSNQLLLLAAQEIETEIRQVISKYGTHRVAVVLGCSTSGIGEGQSSLQTRLLEGSFPKDYSFSVQEMGSDAECLARYFGLTSLTLTVSTACSSSAKAFGIGEELLEQNACDAVLVGGTDSLCDLTVRGFHSLGILSPSRCNPFSKNRNGITIGEGAALFVMSRDESELRLAGWGDSSDAYHMTAPHPEGLGAKICISNALEKAHLKASDINYVNLHGTGTIQNDRMESLVVTELLDKNILCSSSKAMTGHVLGAAGAIEAGLCWLLLSSLNSERSLPPHVWDKERDEEASPVGLTIGNEKLPRGNKCRILSNSFAFGGSNSTIILESA